MNALNVSFGAHARAYITRIVAILLCSLALTLHAQVPQLVNYQGRVAVGGVNFNGSGQFAFALVNTNGSTTYWSNDGTSTAGSQPTAAVTLTVTNGLYSVLLGDSTITNMTAIPASVWANADVRLRVWFNNGGNGFQLLTPDQRLAPNGYLPDGAVTSAKIGTGAITNTQLAAGAVQAGNIAAGAVGSAQLAASAVQAGNIAAGAVGSTQLASGAVGTAQLAAGAFAAPVSVSGTTQTAATNTAYTATNAGLTSFTLPTTASVGAVIQINGAGAGGWNAAEAWTQTSAPTGLTWTSVAGSSDGSKLVAVAFGGAIYISANSGATWTQTTAPSNAQWASVASSSDGTKLVAVASDSNGIYTSANSGTTWTQTSAPTTNAWHGVASSSDGTKLVAVVDGGGIYTSTNSGSTWTQSISAPGNGVWLSVASSSDGSKLVAAGWNGGVYASSDSGVTWARDSAPGSFVIAVASSADGTKLAEAAVNGQVYTSTNSGATWTLTSLPTADWQALASSADGTKLVASAINNGLSAFFGIYTSLNSGGTWTQTSSSNGWGSETSSADGTKVVAAGPGGAIYTGSTGWQGAQGSSATLQYLGNGQWAALGQTQIAAGAVGSTQLASGLALGGTTSGTFSGNLTGNVTGNTSGSAATFTGTLAGDVTGTESATTVASVGGATAANVAAGANLANAATNANTASAIVKRDTSGNFSAGTVSATSLGVGLTTPTHALLEVSGNKLAGIPGTYGYLYTSGAGTFPGTSNAPYSIYCSDRVAAVEVDAYSDARIKNIVGRSDGATDLLTVMGVEITNYTYKDQIAKGSRPVKKVIAQQVEKVFPQAVSRITDVVPDIFKKAAIAANGWIALATDLKQGERVRLIADHAQGIYEVQEVAADGKAFRTAFRPSSSDQNVFVYGREVKDFRVVDYDAIAMLNVSATQQIKKEKDAEIAALRQRLAELEAKDKARDARLSRLENLLSPATLPAAAKTAAIDGN